MFHGFCVLLVLYGHKQHLIISSGRALLCSTSRVKCARYGKNDLSSKVSVITGITKDQTVTVEHVAKNGTHGDEETMKYEWKAHNNIIGSVV